MIITRDRTRGRATYCLSLTYTNSDIVEIAVSELPVPLIMRKAVDTDAQAHSERIPVPHSLRNSTVGQVWSTLDSDRSKHTKPKTSSSRLQEFEAPE
ncbi:hypothetical protein RRG08_005425 [Elysia crispata]|uniref:Uncharacterized protein n=1 Tax=Elysia crispata TaxID=231223 RepID=A0AAE1CR62_9GAST|nr:hypothetical protein RRG08_005425 [Elysia crispata]